MNYQGYSTVNPAQLVADQQQKQHYARMREQQQAAQIQILQQYDPRRAMSSTPAPRQQQYPTPPPPTPPPKRKLPMGPPPQQFRQRAPPDTPEPIGILAELELDSDLTPTIPSTTPAPAPQTTAPTTPQQQPALPPLPPNATAALNPLTTRITLVPLQSSTHTIPSLSPEDISSVKQWMSADRAYEDVWRGMRDRMAREARGEEEDNAIKRWVPVGKGRGWWEKGVGGPEGNGNRWRRAREPFDVRYPRRRAEREARRGKRREGVKLPRKLDIRDVNKPEQLVPIRLEFDVEHHKMRDTFIWNINDPVITPETFAQTLVEDYALSPSYHSAITKSIQDQLSDFRAHSGEGEEYAPAPVPLVEPEGEPRRGRFGEGGEEEGWWGGWRGGLGKRAKGKSGRKKRRVEEGHEGDVEDAGEEEEEEKDKGKGFVWWDRPMRLDEMEVDEARMQEEMRILIKLDIIVGSMKLDDQFEWDMGSEDVSPEDFAEVYSMELGLNGEFKTAIAHSIREQLQSYQKSLFLVGHPSDGTPLQDEDLRTSFLPPLSSAVRLHDQVSQFTPLLNYLSDSEIDRTEKEREKDLTRRRKRNTRGRRGVALPDREPVRTYRTPAIGFPELDPAVLAQVQAVNAPVSRRAAAAAASVTIANMVASENGTAFLPQVVGPQLGGGIGVVGGGMGVGMGAGAGVPQVVVPKVKKSTKGHFKAPSFGSEILRPRAHVVAPTPSTAADISTLPAPLENDPPPPVTTSVVATIVSGNGNGGGSGPGADRAVRVITAKRAKELEREAKEKEFADGQHPNMIDGVWHCSNCGCPDSIAIGRRKGPLGDKSQCGVCGKYWHRHRRPRPVEYNPDPDWHSGIKKDLEQSKVIASAKKKGGAAALRAQQQLLQQQQQNSNSTTRIQTEEPQTPARSSGGGDFDMSVSASARASPARDEERAISPVSSASSNEEAPLALVQRSRSRANNGGSRRITSPPGDGPPTSAGPESKMSGSVANREGGTKGAVQLSPMSPIRSIEPPPWLTSAKSAMMARYPNDKFETILRKVNASSTPEWRIKCLDCPGKLYTPGPGETLANYEVHLKNRQHRQRVNDRLNNEVDS